MLNILNRSKKKREILAQKEANLEEQLNKSTAIQDENNKIQKNTMEVAWKNHEINEDLKNQSNHLVNLVSEHEKKGNILLQQENTLKTKTTELYEREKEVRKQEILIETRKSEQRKNEHILETNLFDTQKEREEIKKRETISDKVKTESEELKTNYENKLKDIETEKKTLDVLKLKLDEQEKEFDKKQKVAGETFEKAKKIDEEIKLKEAEFEKNREKIESSLKEKIEEYERRLNDLDAVKETVDNIKFDKSTEGKEAKIVVKEAIRVAKKSLDDIKTRFDELDNIYCTGTFKGFSTPLSEIDKCFDDLKSQYEQIKEHATSNNLLHLVSTWIDSIEECILKANNSKKAWEFSECYRFLTLGLATCKNYELLLTILNNYSGGTSEEAENVNNEADYYEILGINKNSTSDEIKKAYKTKAKEHHPDKNNGSKEAEEKFKDVQKAYEVLSDPEQKEKYDQSRNN